MAIDFLLAFILTIIPKNISQVYWKLDIFSIYIKELVAKVGSLIFFNINKWLKALLTNTVFIKVALLSIGFLKAIN